MGRQSGNDVVVPDEQVSRRHAEIEERNGGLVVTDLGSSNGTFVNGTRITSAQTLQPGDTVQVGTTVLKVVGSPSSSGAGDYDQGVTQVGGFQPSAQDYGYNSPAGPSVPANDYGQPGGYGQSSPSYGGPSGGSSYDQGQSSYGGSQVAGSSYGGSSAPSYDQGQSPYGGSGASGYGGSPAASGNSYGSGSSYEPANPSAGAGYGQQGSYGQSAGSYDPANPSAGAAYGGSQAAGSSYGGGSYDPANPSAAGYGASAASYDPANPSAGAGYGQQGYTQGQPAYGGQQAYAQPGQQPGQYQQGAYAQPAAAIAPAKKGGLPLPLIIVGAIVVLLIIGALVFFLFLNKGATVGSDIPAPPNSTKIDISAQDIAKLNPEVDQANISKVNYGFYASSDSPASLLTFYQTEMKNRGWTQDTTQSDSTGGLFKKGDQSAGVALLPITSDAQLTGLNAAFPAMNGKIKVGQTMVILASGPSSVFKTTPGA